jgi:hypothetical protein
VIDRKKFFDKIKPMFGSYKDTQVHGIDTILDEWESRKLTDLRWLAYIFATTYHETNRTMEPVREAYWLSEDWRKKNLRYYPYYGRGYVQLTWEENYEKYGIASQPDRALEPPLAAFIMFDGMIKGTFTGKKLSDFFHGTTTDWVGARKIINGTDQDDLIADYARKFHEALLDSVEEVEIPKTLEERVEALEKAVFN